MERELYAPAVLTENGVITAVGQKEDLLRAAGQKAFAIDLCGSALLPGFIDTHSHITALASTMRLVSLEGAKDFHEIASRMKRHIAEKQISPGECEISLRENVCSMYPKGILPFGYCFSGGFSCRTCEDFNSGHTVLLG